MNNSAARRTTGRCGRTVAPRVNAPVAKKRKTAAIGMPPVVVRIERRTGVVKRKTGSGVRVGVSSTCAVGSDLRGTDWGNGRVFRLRPASNLRSRS